MSHSSPRQATVLIVSDNSADANLVRNLLITEFDRVFISGNPDKMDDAVEQYVPDVLVFAFNDIEVSGRHCLDLLHLNDKSVWPRHQAIVLCHKDEVQRAYAMCREGIFGDYVLFWPMTLDAPRLKMSVHNALRGFAAREIRPSSTKSEIEIQGSHLSQRQSRPEQDRADCNTHITMAARALSQAEQGLGSVLDRFSRRLAPAGGHNAIDGQELAALRHEFAQIRQETLQPLKELLDRLQHIFPSELPHNSGKTTFSSRSTILVVDDDEFLRKMVGRILHEEHYQLIYASSGLEALSILRITLPDLILMDVMMPDLDGIETLRKIKAVPGLANIPVVMLTGRSEGAVVIESLKAGARDFIVKPFDRSKLMAKVSSVLGLHAPRVP